MKEKQWNILNNVLNNERKPGTKSERRNTKSTVTRLINHRSKQRRCSIKKGVFKHFAKFAGKTLVSESLFNKVAIAGLRPTMKSRKFRELLPDHCDKTISYFHK